jgi:uncharacterized membrane protein
MKKKLVLIFTIVGIYFLVGCKKTDTATVAPIPPVVDPCVGVTIVPVASKDFTITGQSLGAITVTSPIGSGITYSITGSVFQASTNFFNLPAGSYTITVKNASNCSGTTSVTINDYGAKYYAVKKIINGYCGPCHLNGTISGGQNFDTDNTITTAWARIKARTVDGTPTFMPQGGQLTALDKQKIVDWVNAGHLTTN